MTINKGAAWKATQGEFVLFLLLIFAFIILLFLSFLCILPYIDYNVSFKCEGGDLGCVLILYFSKKKKMLFVFVVFKDFWLCLS